MKWLKRLCCWNITSMYRQVSFWSFSIRWGPWSSMAYQTFNEMGLVIYKYKSFWDKPSLTSKNIHNCQNCRYYCKKTSILTILYILCECDIISERILKIILGCRKFHFFVGRHSRATSNTCSPISWKSEFFLFSAPNKCRKSDRLYCVSSGTWMLGLFGRKKTRFFQKLSEPWGKFDFCQTSKSKLSCIVCVSNIVCLCPISGPWTGQN